MGSPFSAMLLKLYKQNYKINIITNNNSYKHYIVAYFLYVDDTLILFKSSEKFRQAENIVHYLNIISKNIQFTQETQTNNTINLLDLTINITNRKSTQIYTVIPYNFNNLYSTKYLTFNSKELKKS